MAAETAPKRTREEVEAAEEAPVDAKKSKVDSMETESSPTPSSGPVTIGYKTFESGAAAYEYFKKLHSKLRKYQNLNEVGWATGGGFGVLENG